MSISSGITNWFLFRKYPNVNALVGLYNIDDEERQFAIRMRLTEHPAERVRADMMTSLTYVELPAAREQKVIARLSQCVMKDPSEVVRQQALCALKLQVGYGERSKGELPPETYVLPLKALTSWLRQEIRKTQNNVTIRGDFYDLACRIPVAVMTKCKNESSDFISALSEAVSSPRMEADERNAATLLLASFKDSRCEATLQRLAQDADPRVSSNATDGLKEMKALSSQKN